MTGVSSSTRPRRAGSPLAYDRPVAVWLLLGCALVFAVVVIGGTTRLTHSGLSIVEWAPITGALPPITLT